VIDQLSAGRLVDHQSIMGVFVADIEEWGDVQRVVVAPRVFPLHSLR